MLKTIMASCLMAGFLLPTTITYYEPPKAQNQLIDDFLAKYSTEYRVSEKVLRKVISCESQYKINAVNYNDGGKGKHSVGILQFQESTFNHWEKVLGEDLDYYSYHDQIKLGSFMMGRGQGKQWTCYRKFYS